MLAVMGYSADRDMTSRLKPTVVKGASHKRARPAKSQPVDAQELSRRLCIVLVQQKMDTRRQRYGEAGASFTLGQIKLPSKKRTVAENTASKRAKSAKQKSTSTSSEASCLQDYASSSQQQAKTSVPNDASPNGTTDNVPSSGYHHVPRYAASQFVLTTNIDSARKSPRHKLAKAAMKFHLEGPTTNQHAGAIRSEVSPIEQAKAIQRAQDMRERQYERHQTQESCIASSTKLNECEKKLLHRHTLRAHLGPAKEEHCNGNEERRRMSTGSISRRADSQLEDTFCLAIALFSSAKPSAIGDPDEHRVDWTQSDEMAASRAANLSRLSQPSHTELRNLESRRSLRGRLGSFGRTCKDDKPSCPTTENIPEDLPSKAHILGFFSRFKR